MFQQLYQLLGLSRFRRKLLIVFLLFSIMPILFIGFVSKQLADRSLIETYKERNQAQLVNASKLVDRSLEDIVNIQRLILADPSIRHELVSSNEQVYEGDETIGVDTYRNLQRLLSNYLVDQRYVDSVCLFDAFFRSVCHGGSAEREAQTFQTKKWYLDALNENGGELLFAENVLAEETDTFSYVKSLRNPEEFKLDRIGLLVVTIDKSLLEDVHTSQESDLIVQAGDYTVLDTRTDGGIIAGVDEASLESENYIFDAYTNSASGWKLYSVISEDKLLGQLNNIGAVTLALGGGMSVLLMGAMIPVSRRLSGPLSQVYESAIQLFGWPPNEQKRGLDELKVIDGTFKRVASQHKQLNERLMEAKLREKEAELKLLQAQINPHFLYNTLSSIYWLAKMRKQSEIAQMAISLSESFKISLNNGKEHIPLQKELEHIRHYFTIQNIRFRGKFQYKEEVDDRLLNIEILKLLLQPLIENAIIHGLEKKKSTGHVLLRAFVEGDTLVFQIKDDGIGMEHPSQAMHGFGLKNVHERIQLYYGGKSGLTITSVVDQGTVVTIRLQLGKGEILCFG
ncbi:sensor histidine kinase YesM [Shouchella clausii]|nr:sensor histidine kinase YesM [Shouchella clausii]